MTADELHMLRVTRSCTARHEAGHVVMRWLSGRPCTEIGLDSAGNGWCAGHSGARVEPGEALHGYLAGLATMFDYGESGVPDLTRSSADDINQAARLLSDFEWLRAFAAPDDAPVILDVDGAFRRHFLLVCDRLLPFSALIERLGERLARENVVSAKSVAAMCREHAKRRQNKATVLPLAAPSDVGG